jgi:hypothetical protein
MTEKEINKACRKNRRACGKLTKEERAYYFALGIAIMEGTLKETKKRWNELTKEEREEYIKKGSKRFNK